MFNVNSIAEHFRKEILCQLIQRPLRTEVGIAAGFQVMAEAVGQRQVQPVVRRVLIFRPALLIRSPRLLLKLVGQRAIR